jgi:hypothetical protein
MRNAGAKPTIKAGHFHRPDKRWDDDMPVEGGPEAANHCERSLKLTLAPWFDCYKHNTFPISNTVQKEESFKIYHKIIFGSLTERGRQRRGWRRRMIWRARESPTRGGVKTARLVYILGLDYWRRMGESCGREGRPSQRLPSRSGRGRGAMAPGAFFDITFGSGTSGPGSRHEAAGMRTRALDGSCPGIPA